MRLRISGKPLRIPLEGSSGLISCRRPRPLRKSSLASKLRFHIPATAHIRKIGLPATKMDESRSSLCRCRRSFFPLRSVEVCPLYGLCALLAVNACSPGLGCHQPQVRTWAAGRSELRLNDMAHASVGLDSNGTRRPSLLKYVPAILNA